MSTYQQVLNILSHVLQLPLELSRSMNSETPLLGELPEFDSMTVVTLLTALEEHFEFSVYDDEIEAAIFTTVGSLVAFIEQKIS